MKKRYYDLTKDDIVVLIKEADEYFDNMVKNDLILYNSNIHTQWLLRLSVRKSFLIAKKKAKKKFTPLKYRY